MFQDVLDVLQSKGILDNALVVVLSDHGEAFGIPSESLLNVDVDGRVAGLQRRLSKCRIGDTVRAC